ncbi:unnamed protein product [Fusarium venenatum]|uniref:Uncharacterized protein n=1 Tax=Fusarium venenatum TaxID=56646 RepID=A0A2L2TU11_9HYPO|nr:uncharacterized protein FVRRES_00157 [Fusarium venenatum]CEI63645.1 unnamed protein product [Fusarium venenatum]
MKVAILGATGFASWETPYRPPYGGCRQLDRYNPPRISVAKFTFITLGGCT